jgi:hypothetical protein
MPTEEGDEQTDIAFLLNVLFHHNMGWIQQFLKAKELSAKGTKEELRDLVESYLDDESLSATDLVDLLDEIEGWGNQHVFLFKASDALIATLSDDKQVKDNLKKLRLARLFNRRIPLVLPSEPTVSSIEWTAQRIRFIWIERRVYRERREDESYTEGSLEFDAFEVVQSRGIVSFSCDLVSGLAEMLIQRLPTGNDYLAEKNKYQEQLVKFFDVDQLSPQKISGAIKKVDQAAGIRKRSSQLATALGYQVTYTSRSRKDDVYNDPTVRKARKALGPTVAGRLGNFYWPIQGRDIHIKLYAKDQHIGIFGECTEAEVGDVLSEVRGYC